MGRVPGVVIRSAAGVTLLPRNRAEIGGDVGCLATRLTATLESVRGDTLLLTDVIVMTELAAASRCTAQAVALVTTGRTDITFAVREPALGRTFLAGGLFTTISLVLLLAAAWN